MWATSASGALNCVRNCNFVLLNTVEIDVQAYNYFGTKNSKVIFSPCTPEEIFIQRCDNLEVLNERKAEVITIIRHAIINVSDFVEIVENNSNLR